MTYTREQKKQIFDTLPSDLKEAIVSVETFEKIQTVAEKHNLLLDKAGELGDEINLFILGLTKQKDFVGNLEKRLGASSDEAYKIAQDVNTEILDAIKDSLQEIHAGKGDVVADPSSVPTPPSSPKPLTPLEKAGGFEIVNNKIASSSSQYNDKNLDKNKILQSVENPPAPTKVSFVDHLLANPVSTQHTTVEQKPPVPITPPSTPTPQIPAKPATPQEPRKPSVDPYREPIE